MMSYGVGTNENGEVHVTLEVDGKTLGFFFDDAHEARVFGERVISAAAQAHAIKKSREE